MLTKEEREWAWFIGMIMVTWVVVASVTMASAVYRASGNHSAQTQVIAASVFYGIAGLIAAFMLGYVWCADERAKSTTKLMSEDFTSSPRRRGTAA